MSWLNDQLNRNSDKLFIEYGSMRFSYRNVDEMVQAYVQSFLKKKILPQNRIIIYLSSNIEIVEIILACFEIGAIAIPISPNITDNELEIILKNIEPKIIVTNWEYQVNVISYSIPNIPIEELLNSSIGCSIIQNNFIAKKDDIAAIMLTSGTTGIPKAVQLTYGNFESSCSNWNNFLDFQESDQFLCCLPLHHIGGLAVLIRSVIYSFSVNLISYFKADKILKTIKKKSVTIISLVPTMLKRILELEGGLDAMKSLRWILLGGGPSPDYLLNLCIREKLNIVKVYGMSETCSGTVGLKLLEEPHFKAYAGRPFSNAKIWIKNNQICIRGPMVMKGYVGEKDTNGSHNSHDLGRIDYDNLVFLDIRRKDLIISGGENINPIEVEEALISLESITDVAVVGKNDDEWGQLVCAFIVIKDEISDIELKEKLKEKLSYYKIPKEFNKVAYIPRNEIGKILYEKLKHL